MTDPRRANGTARTKLLQRLKREEDTCHLCDQWVDTHLPHGRPGSPEADELIPVTYGGNPLDRANVRLSHRYCNRLRWHGPIHIAREKLAKNKPRFDANGALITTTARPVATRAWL